MSIPYKSARPSSQPRPGEAGAEDSSISHAIEMGTLFPAAIADRLSEAGYTNLVNGSDDARLFAYISNAPRTEQGHIPISTTNYARAMGASPSAERDYHHCVRAHFDQLGALTGMGFKFSSYNPQKGRAREITRWDLPGPLHEILHSASEETLKSDAVCDLATGARFSGVKKRELFEARRHEVNMANAAFAMPDEHREFLWYLNNRLTLRAFPVQAEALQACLNEIGRLYEEKRQRDPVLAENWYLGTVAYVRAIAMFPQPLYGKVDNSPRIYCKGAGLPNIFTPLRRLIFPRVIELDLHAAQAAIIAKVIGVPSLLNFLESGRKLWPHLMGCMGADPDNEELRAVIKHHGMYPACYGMPKGLLLLPHRNEYGLITDSTETQAALAQITPDMRRAFLNTPIMADLLGQRDRALAKIKEEGGMLDAYEEWVEMRDEFNERSVLAYVMQSWEMRLLEPARRLTIEEGGKEHGWRIVIWQHDGFSVSTRSSDKVRVVGKLEGAVARQADAHGIPTRLEPKYDGVK